MAGVFDSIPKKLCQSGWVHRYYCGGIMFFFRDLKNSEWLSVLSEIEKLTDLKERFINVARNERSGLLTIPLGVFLAGTGLIFSLIGSNSAAYFGGILVSGLGVFSTLFGFYVSVHYAHQYNNLLDELENCVRVN